MLVGINQSFSDFEMAKREMEDIGSEIKSVEMHYKYQNIATIRKIFEIEEKGGREELN
jgi:hypothetical protein